MQNLKDYLLIDDRQHARLEQLYTRYRRLFTDPLNCEPMIIVNSPVQGVPPLSRSLADPLTMLRSDLDALRPHLEIGDDRVPTVRINFGTAQIAAAFGCEMFLPPESLPCAASHAIENAEDIWKLQLPSLDAGWFAKLWKWTDLWLDNLPPGVHIQHPDIQSTFNSAHLIRGNDILTDFYDDPAAVDRLLDTVTDYMIAIIRCAKAQISRDNEWFFDWGGLWKGAARISNCSMHMISPEFYRKHVLPRDRRFIQSIGGGRVHYCGTQGGVVEDYFRIPGVSGLDLDWQYHDFFEICRKAPQAMTLMAVLNQKDHGPLLKRLMSGEWPQKRNLIIHVPAPSVDEGRKLLQHLRASFN